MNIKQKIKTLVDVIKNRPHTILGILFGKISKIGIFNKLSDRTYISIQYYLMIGKKLNLSKPITFNEKLQWLKLNNRELIYTNMVDKYKVREIIKHKIGEKYLIPLIGIYLSPYDIDFNKLPDKFVIKCNHDSGSVFICTDKTKIDFCKIQKKLVKNMKKNHFWWSREWPYKNIEPKVIIEKYMKDDNNENLPVYKFLCFNGEPKVIQVIQDDKKENETIDYFDIEWNLLNLRQDYPNSINHYKKPQQLKEMIGIAKKLSEKIPFVRVDLYLVNGKVYFSEFTMFSDAGVARFYPYDWDEKLGEWINLEYTKNKLGGIFYE